MKEEIIQLTKELIRCPSISLDLDHSMNILQIVKSKLTEHPFTPFVSNNIPSLLFSNTDTSQRRFKLILNAHMDVVPGLGEQFIPHERDGNIYGRGAFDMKAAGAVMILVFKELAKQLPYPLGLQITTDEEVGGRNGSRYQLERGVRSDFAIMGEGTGFKIIHEAKSRFSLKLTSGGRTAHAAYPWKGENAIFNMYKALDALLKEYPVPKSETKNTTINISRIDTSNTVINKIPHECFAYLDVRVNPDERNSIVTKLESLLPKGIIMEVIGFVPAHITDKNSPFIAALQKSGKNVLHKNMTLALANGGSDASFYTEFGCEAVEFGPMGHGHHSDDENIEIASLVQYYMILKDFLLSYK